MSLGLCKQDNKDNKHFNTIQSRTKLAKIKQPYSSLSFLLWSIDK